MTTTMHFTYVSTSESGVLETWVALQIQRQRQLQIQISPFESLLESTALSTHTQGEHLLVLRLLRYAPVPHLRVGQRRQTLRRRLLVG